MADNTGAVKKNSDGHLGKICNWCGGYGFLNSILGGSHGCIKCEGSGVELPSRAELSERLASLEGKK